MNKYEENVYKNMFEYPTKKIVELEFKNEVLENENQLLKKQKANVVGHIKNCKKYRETPYTMQEKIILRMLGEIDE